MKKQITFGVVAFYAYAAVAEPAGGCKTVEGRPDVRCVAPKVWALGTATSAAAYNFEVLNTITGEAYSGLAPRPFEILTKV